jgi:hypothetical protein
MGIFEDWQSGVLTDAEALRALTRDLGEVESELAPLHEQREQLRAWIGEVLARAGGKAAIPGFGRLELSAPSVTVTFDRKALDGLVQDLVAAGQFDIAQRISAARRESARAGALRITREKP